MTLAIQIAILIAIVIFSAGFIVLAISIVSTLNRLKVLFVKVEKMSSEITGLTEEIKKISMNVEDKLNRIDAVMESSKKAVKVVREIAAFASNSVLSKATGILALLPAIKFGWKLVNDIKGDQKNVE